MGQAERAVERYLRLRERLSAPRAQDVAAVRGWIYAERCRACRHPHRREVHNERAKAWVTRCARCGAAWPREAAMIPRAAVDGGRHVNEPAGLADLATLAAALATLPDEERGLLVASVLWRGPGRADLGLVEVAEQRWPSERGWTQYRIRRTLGAAREALERELQRRGMA